MSDPTKAELRAKLAEAERERDDNLKLALSYEKEIDRLKRENGELKSQMDVTTGLLDHHIRRNNDLHADLANRAQLARDTVAGVVEMLADVPPAPVQEYPF